MSPQIRPNRLVVNDRFPMLGFSIRTDGTPQRAEVTIATDPALFADPSRRTPANFFSTRQLGALSVPKGEAVYVLPPEILARFIGSERLYFGLATAPATNGAGYEVAVMPAEDSPYVSISGLTGRSLRRVRMFPGRRRRPTEGSGYGENGGAGLIWAGDAPSPGMERAEGTGAGRAARNGRTNGNGAARAGSGNGGARAARSDGGAASNGEGTRNRPNGATNGNGGGEAAAPVIDYDDGFGPMPPAPGARERPSPSVAPVPTPGPTAQALEIGDISLGEMQPVEPPSVSSLGFAASTAIQLALAANPALTTIVAAARVGAEVADVSIGLGPAVSGGFVGGASLGVGLIFASGNRLGVYGAADISVGAIASLSATLQVTVLNGDIESFSGMTYAAGFSAGEGVVGGGAAIFDSERRFLGVSFHAGAGVGSPLDVYASVQRQVATELGHAAAFGDAPPPAFAMIIGKEDVQKAQRYAPAWADLFNWTVPAAVDAEVRRRGMSVQRIRDAVGSLNLDRYEVRCTRLPSGYTAEALLDHVRRNMNSFVDTGNTEFDPYSAADRTRWEGPSPVGAIFNLDIIGPDNAAVVGSLVEPRRFRFTTIETPDTGSHPVSGHREFGVRPEGDAHVFYTRGADRSTLGIAETLIFAGGDSLWKSFQRKLAAFINANGGAATAPARFSERFHADVVRILFGGASAQAMGEGYDPLAVEVKYRMFIPSPVINGPPLGDDYGGDGRGFSYDAGTSRGEITAIVHLTSGLGTRRIELKDRHWGESTAYDSDDTFHVSGKPDWWLDKREGARVTERATLAASDDNLRIYPGSPGQRGIRIMAENASAVTIEAEGALPLSRIAPDIDADVSVLFRNRNGVIQAKALGEHDGFPAHELYVNGEPLYRYDPVAAGNGPTSLLGSGDIDVDTPWTTIARTYTVRIGTQGLGDAQGSGSHTARGLEFNESFTVNWDEVQSIPQPTDTSCWAAAAAMVIGWRDRVSLTPETIARITGRTTATLLDPARVGEFANDLGLLAEPPQSYTPQAFRALLEDNGPLWVGAAVPGLHIIVVTGLYNEGEQLYVRITDPWDRAVGTPGTPGDYARTHVTGSRYIMKWEDFVAEYEAAATDYASVNLQILHSGGTNGRMPNIGGTTPPGYAQALAGAPLPGLAFSAPARAVEAPVVEIVQPAARDPAATDQRWHALAAERFGEATAAALLPLAALARESSWTIGVGPGARPGIALEGAIGAGIGVTREGALIRYGEASTPAGNGADASRARSGRPLLLTVVSGSSDAFSAWSKAIAFSTAEPGVASGAVLLGETGVPVGITVMLDIGANGDFGQRLAAIADAVQDGYAAATTAPGRAPAAQALDGDTTARQRGPAGPGAPDGGFPPPGARILRSPHSKDGVDYELFLMDGPVPPQTPPQVAQDLIPGEKVTLTDWPYIDGPSGRTSGGVAIEWSHGAGTVANVRTTPAGGQVRDGWRVRVRTDIGPGPSTPTETKLRVTVRTTFSRDGEADQTGVSEVVLCGSGRYETQHRDETAPEPVPA